MESVPIEGEEDFDLKLSNDVEDETLEVEELMHSSIEGRELRNCFFLFFDLYELISTIYFQLSKIATKKS
jgi:hypothetical protein